MFLRFLQGLTSRELRYRILYKTECSINGMKKEYPMDISPHEAEEALETIRNITQKTRHAIARGGTYITLIVTGVVWLIGFICTQFLPQTVTGYIWAGLSIIGGIMGTILGVQMGKRVRSPMTIPTAKRIGMFWLLLALYAVVIILLAHPVDGKQATLFIILFIMLGQLAMGLLFSFSSFWWALPVSALALVGYLFLPNIFYLWMAILGGGGMIALGVYIRLRW